MVQGTRHSVEKYYNWERQIVKEATQQYALPAPAQGDMLIRVNPDAMPGGGTAAIESVITLREHTGGRDFSDLPEQEKYTADGRPLKCIGTDDVQIELVREPGRVYKRVYRCRVYADLIAEAETGKADIRRPHVPAPLLPGGYASASVVMDIIVKKYADALPLYRQEQM